MRVHHCQGPSQGIRAPSSAPVEGEPSRLGCAVHSVPFAEAAMKERGEHITTSSVTLEAHT